MCTHLGFTGGPKALSAREFGLVVKGIKATIIYDRLVSTNSSAQSR